MRMVCCVGLQGGEALRSTGEADDLPTVVDWIEVFRKSIPTFRTHALTDESVPGPLREAAADRFAADFNAALDALLADPSLPAPGYPASQPINCATLCQLREDCLHGAGFGDVFAAVKARENERALALLPGVLAEFDALEGRLTDQWVAGGRAADVGAAGEWPRGYQRCSVTFPSFPSEPDTPFATPPLELALRGVFAGNIFDLGAEASAQLHAAGGSAFAATRARLLPRPWAVDDMDALLGAVGAGLRWRKAALFVDNAGPDVVLGMLPLARLLCQAGSQVLLMANRGATINDITAPELQDLLARAAPLDPVLAEATSSGALRVVCSGSDLPVIDLTQLSPEAVEAAADCDLIVLEGMGRGIETNLHAALSCDSLKLGMIKHPEVAAHFSGRLYDCVCKFDRGLSGEQPN
ncbi:hypothetical protein GPECTOR_22g897 [Gonium pectorale]|uniref:Damage-control phosphatase ARMT1-like metal-binding domain-containing protein n=1 Tax=Gonium pectorale TaxID=33097 RepID=A0A150GHN7_GONPE|nr:hypothetical protein GPECTOR_22g897 [Gonium pectorale]|eukprot:KXZ49303.1 hypothetical protein GPECTOR_22g897 [Gonium pectorale]